MTALRHLVHLCGGTWFRRLLGVRLASQLSDGVLQAALASYALFGQDQATAAQIATALAVVLLPFSLLGPFAGVFLDRWSRRQVLVLANLVRVAIALVLAGVVATGLPDPVFYGVVLLCLSVNRFLLAGLSASLPHTVVARRPGDRQRPDAHRRDAGLPGRARHRRPGPGRHRGGGRGGPGHRRPACTASRACWRCASPATSWGRTRLPADPR